MTDLGYGKDREFGDKFIGQVASILGQVLFIPANAFEDMHHNTDLTLKLNERGTIEIAMRIRRKSQLKEEYKDEFTLCCHRGSGADAEYQKIIGSGKQTQTWGDYIFYGFSDETEENLVRWFIGDFKYFRLCVPNIGFSKYENSNDPSLGILYFKDTGKRIGESSKVKRTDKETGIIYYDYFYAYDRGAFPGFVIADSDHWSFKMSWME